MDMKKPPGIMIYASSLKPILQYMSDAEAGQLLKALFDYYEGKGFCIDDFIDDAPPMVRAAFDIVADSMDRSSESYRASCLRNAYNRYRGVMKQRGHDDDDILSFEDWKKEGAE